MPKHRSALVVLGLALSDALALGTLRPEPRELGRGLADPQAWVDRVGADGAALALASAALWVMALWLAVGLSFASAAYLPGVVGARARRLARATLPRALYRAVAGAAGLGVLLAPVAAGAVAPRTGSASVNVPGPTLPPPVVPTSGPTVPAPVLPASTRPDTTAPPAPAAGYADVTVRAGDSLWRIAAAHLPRGTSDARIAAAWPRWYAANRAAVGPDPNQLATGTVLHAPSEQEAP